MGKAQRSKRVKHLLATAKRTSDSTQASLLKAEDTLTAIEQREARRAARQPVAPSPGR